jgi:hypothetical protein
MVAAKSAYQLQLRTDDIVAAVQEVVTAETVVGALRQLQDWGCARWVQDTTFAARRSGYLRRHEL